MCGVKRRRFIVLFGYKPNQLGLRKCPHDHWLANKSCKQYHSDKKILGVLPRRWRRKTAAIDMKQNYVTVATYPVRHRADGHTVTTHVDVHDVDSSHQWQHAQPHHEHEVHHWNSKQVATLTAASGRIAAVPLRIALNISTASKPGHAKVWPPKCPFPPGDSDVHVIHRSLGPPESTSQWHHDRFIRFCRVLPPVYPANRQTHRPTTPLQPYIHVAVGRYAMRPKTLKAHIVPIECRRNYNLHQ